MIRNFCVCAAFVFLSATTPHTQQPDTAAWSVEGSGYAVEVSEPSIDGVGASLLLRSTTNDSSTSWFQTLQPARRFPARSGEESARSHREGARRGLQGPRLAPNRGHADGCRGRPARPYRKVLNHVEGGARPTRVSDRHTYDPEKRMALDAWDRALAAVLERSEASKVLFFASTERSR